MKQTTRVLSLLAAAATSSALLLAPPASAADTTTALTSNANPSTVGQSVTLTATVTGGTPTGDITFADSGTTLGTATLSSGVATLEVSSLAAGDHALTATFADDGDDTGSVGSLTQTVTAPAPPPPPPPAPAPVKPPKVHLSISAKQASVGDKVTLHWRTKRADTVMASGDWGGAQRTKGQKQIRITERGKHVFRLTVENATARKTAEVQLTATRKAKELELVVTDELVLVGTDVDVAADGLAKRETYTIRLAGKPVLTGKADKRGNVERTFKVAKTAAEGALDLTITGSNPGRKGTAVLNVIKPKTFDVEVDRPELKKKKEQTITVTGLAAGEEVTVMYAGKKLTTGKADASGEFTYSFNVGTETGERTVKVIGAVPTRAGEATFIVIGAGGDTGGTGGGGGDGGGGSGPTPSG